jgi:secondary thiamine-phosphate synthase enzyme
MTVRTDTISVKTSGNSDTKDVTPQLASCVKKSGINNGIAHIFCAGSTGALTTTEFEPGAVRDIKEFLDRNMPPTPPGPPWGGYFHHETWHDDNGHSHLRSSLIGPDIAVPIRNGSPRLGTWQQVIFIDCDTRSRTRELFVTIIGE